MLFLYGTTYVIIGIIVTVLIVRNTQKYCEGFEDFKLQAAFLWFFALVWPMLIAMGVLALLGVLLKKLFPNEVE